MTERQQQRRMRAKTCTSCGARWIWPDAFPHPASAECNRCARAVTTQDEEPEDDTPTTAPPCPAADRLFDLMAGDGKREADAWVPTQFSGWWQT